MKKIYEQIKSKCQLPTALLIYIFVITLPISAPSCGSFGYYDNQQKEYTYTGTVTQHLYEPPTSGYKSSRDAKYWILMRENKRNMIIRVPVPVPTYYSLNDGEVTSFTIKNIDMYEYGNTNDWKKNLYGE